MGLLSKTPKIDYSKVREGEAPSFNLAKIEDLIRQLLVELHDDPNRSGLLETPHRVAKFYQEIFEGQLYNNHYYHYF